VIPASGRRNIPIQCRRFGAVLLVMTIMGVSNHMGWGFPRWLFKGKVKGSWLINRDPS